MLQQPVQEAEYEKFESSYANRIPFSLNSVLPNMYIWEARFTKLQGSMWLEEPSTVFLVNVAARLY